MPLTLPFGHKEEGDKRMRYASLAIALAAVMVAGCATTPKSYQTTTTVSPAGQQQYTVEFRIQETAEDGTQNVLSAPTAVTMAGKEATIKVCDEKEEDVIFCTVLVNETANGVEALTTITVKEDGKKILSTSQKTVMKK